MMIKRVPFCDVVLMLIREQPGLTSTEITRQAASSATIRSLLSRKPTAAISLLIERLNMTQTLDRGVADAVSAATTRGYVAADHESCYRITPAGQTWLMENSGL
jgi:hypothetical protein